MIVVVDTNVWISALISRSLTTTPVLALKRAVRDDVLAIAPDLRDEILRVLIERFGWHEQQAIQEVDDRLIGATVVRLKHSVHLCRDPKDNMFLECAALANADVLVSGDKDLLVLGSYAGTRIVTALQYLALEP